MKLEFEKWKRGRQNYQQTRQISFKNFTRGFLINLSRGCLSSTSLSLAVIFAVVISPGRERARRDDEILVSEARLTFILTQIPARNIVPSRDLEKFYARIPYFVYSKHGRGETIPKRGKTIFQKKERKRKKSKASYWNAAFFENSGLLFLVGTCDNTYRSYICRPIGSAVSTSEIQSFHSKGRYRIKNVNKRYKTELTIKSIEIFHPRVW